MTEQDVPEGKLPDTTPPDEPVEPDREEEDDEDTDTGEVEPEEAE